jgi:hypothetical protein
LQRKAPMKSALPVAENGSTAKLPIQIEQSAPVRPKRARTAVKQEAEEVNLRLPDSSEKQAEAVSTVDFFGSVTYVFMLPNFVAREVHEDNSPTPEAQTIGNSEG